MNWNKRGLALIAVAAVAIAGVVWLARPSPIAVDLAPAARSAMEVTVDDEAKTRIRHVYTVSAPLAGKVMRAPREVGDQVTANETVVAVMQPSTPAFHDARTHEELSCEPRRRGRGHCSRGGGVPSHRSCSEVCPHGTEAGAASGGQWRDLAGGAR